MVDKWSLLTKERPQMELSSEVWGSKSPNATGKDKCTMMEQNRSRFSKMPLLVCHEERQKAMIPAYQMEGKLGYNATPNFIQRSPCQHCLRTLHLYYSFKYPNKPARLAVLFTCILTGGVAQWYRTLV
jgi:hypothetical protein